MKITNKEVSSGKKNTMSETLGPFIECGDSPEYLLINFLPNTLPIRNRWRNNGLSADFLADYWSSFFPDCDRASRRRQSEIRDAVSFIANELLENAMKFSYDASKYPISIGLYLFPGEVRFYMTNSIDTQCCDRLRQFIQDILSEDPEEMYIRQMEDNAARDRSGHLGFLTIMSDYDAQLAWKLETGQMNSGMIVVTTMVRLPLE